MRRELHFFNPWRDLDQFHQEVNSFFGWPIRGEKFSVAATDGLPLNVWVNDDGALLHAPLPGVKPESIEISVLGDTLTLQAKRMPKEAGEDTKMLRRERAHGEFSRTVQLPFRVDNSAVQARYNDGILALNLPRAATDKKRRIEVQAA